MHGVVHMIYMYGRGCDSHFVFENGPSLCMKNNILNACVRSRARLFRRVPTAWSRLPRVGLSELLKGSASHPERHCGLDRQQQDQGGGLGQQLL